MLTFFYIDSGLQTKDEHPLVPDRRPIAEQSIRMSIKTLVSGVYTFQVHLYVLLRSKLFWDEALYK